MMIRTLLAVMVLCLGGVLWADGPATQPASTQPAATQPSASAKPINKMCAVNQKDEVDPKITLVYQGKVIGFCCSDCIVAFKKDPQKYMKTLK